MNDESTPIEEPSGGKRVAIQKKKGRKMGWHVPNLSKVEQRKVK
jgi:hypothetical protein